MSPSVLGAVEGRTEWGARGRLNVRVCVEWGARVAEGAPQAPLCLGSRGSGRLPLNPRAFPQGLHCKVRLAESSSWQGRVRFMVTDRLPNLLLPFLSFYPCLAPRVVLWIF